MKICLSLLLLALALTATVSAQGQPSANISFRTPQVTATATTELVRFAALGEAVEMRLEIFASGGEKLFDSDFKAGNLLDWRVQDQQGQRLGDGAYRCMVTVKDLAGRLARRQGRLAVQAGEVTLREPEHDPFALRAAEPLNVPGHIDFLTLVRAGATNATVLAHDGNDGRLVTGSGALSFRTGDFFAGRDVERMRLTAEGNLGLGIEQPQARLDVGGLIRAGAGIMFPDGTIQTTAASAPSRSVSERGSTPWTAASMRAGMVGTAGKQEGKDGAEDLIPTAPNISGSGTTNRITKWIDGAAGEVGDSVISEVGGNVGIGTTTPLSGLDYRNSLAPFFTRDIGTTNFGIPQSALQLGVTNTHSRNVGVGPSFLFFADNSAGSKSFLGRVSAAWENPLSGAEAGSLRFQVRANSGDMGASTERMRITAGGNVGIGTTSPLAKLEVAAADSGGVRADNNSLQPTILAVNTGIGSAVYAQNNSGGLLHYSAVRGINNGTGGFGVYGSADNGTDAVGVRGTSAAGHGVYGRSDTGHGVWGENTASTINGGVYGASSASNGNGVIGEANTGSFAFGVWGKSTSGYGVRGNGAAAGVYGFSSTVDGSGVLGESNTGANAFGVWGKSTSGFAGKFNGNVDIVGTLSKSGGSFKIDHPLDPANKYLYHSFVESPDMLNIYNGNITTDANGAAEIVLPDYFAALNRDFRYQLTVIGQFAQAIVASEIQDNRFTIKTDKPAVKVSWQVTGIRHDAYADAHRIPIVEEKPELERGYFLHPKLYGQPAEKSIEWAQRPELMRRLKEQRDQRAPEKPPKQ